MQKSSFLVITPIIFNICHYILENGVDWIITALITFLSVRIATHRYYDSTKKQVSKGIMELGLRSLLQLEHDAAIPDYAQAIFVKYGGRCMKKNDECKFGEKIRKTVTVVGGNENEVSLFKPINYGVLGVANALNTPVLYDFKLHKLYQYKKECIIELDVKAIGTDWFYMGKHFLGAQNSERDVMIAIPLKSDRKLVGGLTFDLKPGNKTLYQQYLSDDNDHLKEIKDSTNIKVFKEVNRASRILVNAYFKKKGEEFE